MSGWAVMVPRTYKPVFIMMRLVPQPPPSQHFWVESEGGRGGRGSSKNSSAVAAGRVVLPLHDECCCYCAIPSLMSNSSTATEVQHPAVFLGPDSLVHTVHSYHIRTTAVPFSSSFHTHTYPASPHYPPPLHPGTKAGW